LGNGQLYNSIITVRALELDATIITSYDYGSPITESGQITDKFLALRRMIKQIPGWKNKPRKYANICVFTPDLVSPIPANHTQVVESRVKLT
jgi:hypothetical protein